MTGTAIPIPDDAADRMARQAQNALDVFTRAWAPVIRDLERSATAAGRALSEHMEPPTGARIELTMEHGRPAIRGYDTTGHQVLGTDPDPRASGHTSCPNCDPTREEA